VSVVVGPLGELRVKLPPSAKQSLANVLSFAKKSSLLLFGQPLHVQTVEPVPVAYVPPNDAQSRCDCVLAVLVPVSEAISTVFMPNAISVALSLAPSVVGAYWTVTLHDFLGPRLLAVHVSAVTENADEPSARRSAPPSQSHPSSSA
jgi:hypothetical protein